MGGQLKFSTSELNNVQRHSGWVSCVRFSPDTVVPTFVSSSWDKSIRVWSLENRSLTAQFTGHKEYINAVTVSPDGSLCASGGKDGKAMLWDLSDNKHLKIWKQVMLFMLWLSAQSDTGCAQLLHKPLKSGIWNPNNWLKNSNRTSLNCPRRLYQFNVSLWLGLQMVKLCLLVTLTTPLECGKLKTSLKKNKFSANYRFIY